ncbi:hypothetical protein [Jannaschia formosa]|uniref:hypothetical protein n=1 Tax=Jannaschia formosa TaxID=2259592 RepID=UPI001074F99E|nr:hypothetical protein [Jannaschia formosa]TFL17594.1 hypothetical protein DR046_14290 [Jannaschia formosa]
MLEEQEDDARRWRVKWVGGLALLRAVGHVLLHEDSKRDSFVADRNRQLFESWQRDRAKNAIFWNFIVPERDKSLKHYEIDALILDTVSLGVMADENLDLMNLEGDLYRGNKGPYRTGDDLRDIYGEAVVWWDDQLAEIGRYST